MNGRFLDTAYSWQSYLGAASLTCALLSLVPVHVKESSVYCKRDDDHMRSLLRGMSIKVAKLTRSVIDDLVRCFEGIPESLHLNESAGPPDRNGFAC